MSDNVLTGTRKALAAFISDGIGIPVTAGIPSTPRAGTGFLRPPSDDKYVKFTGEKATWLRPEVRLSLVLIAPGNDWEGAHIWIDDQICGLYRAISSAKELSNGATRPSIVDVSPPGKLDTGGQLLAIEVTFSPIYTQGLI